MKPKYVILWPTPAFARVRCACGRVHGVRLDRRKACQCHGYLRVEKTPDGQYKPWWLWPRDNARIPQAYYAGPDSVGFAFAGHGRYRGRA